MSKYNVNKKRKRKKKPKYPNFELDWNINNPLDFDKALEEVTIYANRDSGPGPDIKVKEMVDPDLYNKLSRGDKCRLGRAVSYAYNNGKYFGSLERGEKKGSTNTYHKI